jgi:cell division transport system permease protein
MKHNRLGYYIKEGTVSIFNHGLMSFASVCIIVACLIIMGSFGMLAINVDGIIDDLESQNEILAFVDESLDESAARALQSQIESVPNVSRAEFITKQEALDSYESQYDDKSLFEGLDASVLRDRYVIYLDDISLMSQTQDDLNDISGIAKVNAHLEISQGFVTVRNIVTAISLVLVVILLVVSLFIMSNTIKLGVFERREEIAIMKMVGATNAFIRFPFIIEGMLLGLMGSLIAFLLQWGIYQLVTTKLLGLFAQNFINVLSFGAAAIPLLLIFLIIGLAVGIFGSNMALKNYLKV